MESFLSFQAMFIKTLKLKYFLLVQLERCFCIDTHSNFGLAEIDSFRTFFRLQGSFWDLSEIFLALKIFYVLAAFKVFWSCVILNWVETFSKNPHHSFSLTKILWDSLKSSQKSYLKELTHHIITQTFRLK